jgi:LCP family protein required for cell wall assembly
MTRGQRWVIVLLTLAVVMVGAVVGGLYLAKFRMTDLGTIPSLAQGNGTYVLVGSDSRANLPDDLAGKFGDFSGARADVIILMQVTDGVREMISIPRDLKVDIPGHGTNKINAAYAFGGPDLLVETLSQETGVAINQYVEVGFGGLAGIVDALGGIELNFPAPARDLKSGLNVTKSGRQVVDGATALAYARSRHYEEKRNGEWQSVGGSDIARTGRQREVLMKIVDKASSPSGVLRSPVLLTRITGNLAVDSTVSPFGLVRTAWAFRSASETQAVSLPVSVSNEGGVSYVVRKEPEAGNMLEAFAGGGRLPEG